jgi:methyl-accepting chemotaxis protein
MLVRIETLNEQLVSTNGALEKTQMRLQGTDDTVGELMPLVDRMAAVEVHSKDHVNELTSLKESLTNTIDTTDELIRRLEEAEEIVEGLESSVTNRMNQVRAVNYVGCITVYLNVSPPSNWSGTVGCDCGCGLEKRF